MKRRTLRNLYWLWFACAALGVIGVGWRLVVGERSVGYGSYVSWGLWVALYFHAVAISGGVFVVGVIGYFLRLPWLRDHLPVTLWTSAAALVTGLVAIGLDLGRPLRAIRLLFSPNFESMMAFNGWMYGAFLLLVAGCFVLARRAHQSGTVNDDSGWLMPLLVLGAAMGAAFPSQSGVFFGVVEAKPFWSSALLPVLFLTGAVASGAAVLLLIATFLPGPAARLSDQPFRYLRWMTAGAALLYFVFEFGEISLALWAPNSPSREAVELVMFGPFWWVFWLVHLGGGGLAVTLLVRGVSLQSVGTGAFLVALTFVSARLNVLIPGQSLPELAGLRNAFHDPRLNFFYQATAQEYLVALFVGALGTALVYLGLRFLTGITSAQQETL